MHWFIDILALIVLLFFLMNGWRRGTLLSLLGVARILVSFLIACVVGKYLGNWLANTFYRPRLITIPAIGICTFSIVAFIFRIAIVEIRDHQKDKAEQDGLHIPILSRLSGSVICGASSIMALAILFWVLDMFLAGFFGVSVPGAEKSKFAASARRIVYETSYRLTARKGKESQAAAMSSMVSNPNKGFKTMESILEADSIQSMLTTPQFATDFLSGEAARIQTNETMQAFFNDTETLQYLRDFGALPRNEEERTPAVISDKMAQLGSKMQAKLNDEQIQICIDQLKQEKMLAPAKIPELVRDGRFHIILDGLLK